MLRIDDLLARVAGYMPPEADLSLISKAYVYSATLHRHHFTPGGRPTLQHALEVSGILADLRLDPRCIVAGLLYDVLEQELADAAALRAVVGEEVAGLVEELSRLSKAAYHATEAARAEHLRQMMLASTKDLRVILTLLAGRLQYLREAEQLPAEMKEPLARETLAIYAPIAHRLGVHAFKAEMEDRAFAVLEPEAAAELQARVDARLAARTEKVQQINGELEALLAEHGVQGEVLSRPKHLYSIHTKMQRNNVDLDQVYDLLASRIIVESAEDCYRVLGLIHAQYTPIPGRFKDYIALPKDNGYQSLHTLVFGSSGDIFEIQVRTREMHRLAEMGIAAHFIYKDGSRHDETELASVDWFRRVLESLESGQSPQESMELLTRDLAPEPLFVFTPRGEVVKLPPGATAIDFAYAIHTEVGHHCIGAKMDGRMVPLRTALRTGSVVEILTHPRQEPKEDWLKFAVSSRALGRIRSYLRKQAQAEAVREGREQVLREVRRAGRRLEDLFANETFREWLHRHAINTQEELFAAEGFGRISVREGLEKLQAPQGQAPAHEEEPELPRREPRAVRRATAQSRSEVRVQGMDDMMTRFARCCSPLPGDPIVGVITRGRGVSVHHTNCPNLARQALQPGRLVDVSWADEDSKDHSVTLAITARTSMKEVLEVVSLLEEEGLQITSGRVANRNGRYTQHLTLRVESSRQLDWILQRLNAMEGIRAERVLESA